MNEQFLRAVDLALENNWDAAHRIVQEFESHATANWIHAVLHKIEGDRSNSRYWYARALKLEYADHEPIAELQSIREQLMA